MNLRNKNDAKKSEYVGRLLHRRGGVYLPYTGPIRRAAEIQYPFNFAPLLFTRNLCNYITGRARACVLSFTSIFFYKTKHEIRFAYLNIYNIIIITI